MLIWRSDVWRNQINIETRLGRNQINIEINVVYSNINSKNVRQRQNNVVIFNTKLYNLNVEITLWI